MQTGVAVQSRVKCNHGHSIAGDTYTLHLAFDMDGFDAAWGKLHFATERFRESTISSQEQPRGI